MANKVDKYIKLQVAAAQANPSPPVGPALGQGGVNIMEFCKAFNAQTQGMEPGTPIPVIITVYNDRSFTFVTKTPPASVDRVVDAVSTLGDVEYPREVSVVENLLTGMSKFGQPNN